MLKTTHCRVCHGSKDPVDLGSVAGVTRQVAELKLLLHTSYRVTPAPRFDVYYKSQPCRRTDDSVSG